MLSTFDMPISEPPRRAASLAACAPAVPPYRMLLRHDGQRYIAEVPELDGCRGYGASYAEAVLHAEAAIAAHLATADRACAPPLAEPAMLLKKLRECLSAEEQAQHAGRRIHPVKRALLERYGKLSNRELAARIGLIERDAPLVLSAAASGKGTRRARCAIAIALGRAPSELWPDRAAPLCEDDDAAYWAIKASKAAMSTAA